MHNGDNILAMRASNEIPTIERTEEKTYCCGN